MLRSAIVLVVVASVVGAMMPAGDPSPPPAADAPPSWFEEDRPVTAAAVDAARPVESSSTGGEVRLERRGDGHFYANVEINGTATEFMIDTGATGIALTQGSALRANVAINPSDHGSVGVGAGGDLTGTFVTLDRVALGGETATGMRAAVIDGASTNLLGQSFLSRFGEVTVKGDVMTLR